MVETVENGGYKKKIRERKLKEAVGLREEREREKEKEKGI